MEITTRHWLIALLIAILAHVALALALVSDTAPRGNTPGGIVIELGGDDAAGPGDSGSGSPGSGLVQPVTSPAIGLRDVTAAPRDDEDQATSAGEPSEQATLKEVAPAESIVARALPEPEPAPEPEPKPKRDPQPTPTSAPRPDRAKPEQRPRAAEAQAKRTDTKAKREHANPVGEAPRASSATDQKPAGDRALGARSSSKEAVVSGAPGAAATDTGQGGNGGGSGGTGSGESGGQASASNYYGRLATWLARHKRYPAQAQRLRQEGTVKVTFTITRSGQVISKRIIKSSGYALLDQEVQDMLERASPLPRIPSSLGRSSLTITVPVAFALR